MYLVPLHLTVYQLIYLIENNFIIYFEIDFKISSANFNKSLKRSATISIINPIISPFKYNISTIKLKSIKI